MSYLNDFTTWVIGICGSLYAFVTGNTDKAFQVLLLIMVVDIVTGIMKGIHKKRLKSSIMSLGIMKKGGILVACFFAGLLDSIVNDGNTVFLTMMTWLSIGNEGLSIIENLSALGVKFPSIISSKLAQLVEAAQEIQDEKDK